MPVCVTVSIKKVEESDQAASATLEVENLTKHFGEIKAVSGVDLSIKKGEMHTVIGPNGAGKTTLFNLISGTLRPTKGVVRFNGEDVTDNGLSERTRKGVTRVYQSAQIFPELPVRENLRVAAQSLDRSLNPFSQQKEEHTVRAEEMLELLDMYSKADSKASSLSHGNKKRLEIGMSLATEPDCLLLDEPTSGVSEEDSQRIIEQLIGLTQDITVLLIEHDIDIVVEVSDRISALENGQLIAQGTPDEIQQNKRVQQAYLGDYV